MSGTTEKDFDAQISNTGRSVPTPLSQVTPEGWMIRLVCISIVMLTWLVFGQTLRHEFVNFDDNDYVYNNVNVVRGLNITGVGWAFTHIHSGNWHPLTTLSHMLDCQLYGLHAWGHHLTNVLLHATAAIFLFFALYEMTTAFWRSAFVAALFAIHPLRVESVAWVSERKDVISGVFFMLTLWTYARYAHNGQRSLGRYAVVLISFGLGLMCKPTLVTVPFVLLLLDYWPLQHFANSAEQRSYFAALRRLITEKIPFFVLSAASCVVTLLAQKEAIDVLPQLSLPARLGNAITSYVIYLGQMIYPSRLAAFYPHPIDTLQLSKVILSLSLLITISAAAILWRRKYPFFPVGWFWYLGMLFPMIGIVQVGLQARADRYTYLPQIGILILITWLAADLCGRFKGGQRILVAFASAIIILLAVIASAQATYWRNSETLWRHTLDCTSHNFIALDNFGGALLEKGRTDEAIDEFQKALEVKPDSAETHNNLSAALLRKGLVNDAIAHYAKAIEINPRYAEAHSNLGAALMQKGRVEEAIAHYQKAIEINPDFAQAHNNLGATLMRRQRLDEAIVQFKEAIEINSNYADPHTNIANAFLQKGQRDEALIHYQTARELQSDLARARDNENSFQQRRKLNVAIAERLRAVEANASDAQSHNNLANVLREAGYFGEGIIHYEKAIEINPALAEAHNGLANTLVRRGQLSRAVLHYQKAVEINPDFAEAHSNLGNALLQNGEVHEAIVHCQRAIELRPDNASFHSNLALVLATSPDASLRDGSKAVELARQANELSGWNEPDILGTLAAAYAESGRFSEALETAQKALQLASRQGNEPLAQKIQSDLNLYRARSPLRLRSMTSEPMSSDKP